MTTIIRFSVYRSSGQSGSCGESYLNTQPVRMKQQNKRLHTINYNRLRLYYFYRFRQDGIIHYATSTSAYGFPYSPRGKQADKNKILLTKLIPGNAYTFPNETLTPLERVCYFNVLALNVVQRHVFCSVPCTLCCPIRLLWKNEETRAVSVADYLDIRCVLKGRFLEKQMKKM